MAWNIFDFGGGGGGGGMAPLLGVGIAPYIMEPAGCLDMCLRDVAPGHMGAIMAGLTAFIGDAAPFCCFLSCLFFFTFLFLFRFFPPFAGRPDSACMERGSDACATGRYRASSSPSLLQTIDDWTVYMVVCGCGIQAVGGPAPAA